MVSRFEHAPARATPFRTAALGAVLLALAACGSENGARPCALVYSPTGISIDIAAPDASRVSSASIRACWGGTCRTRHVALHPSSTSVPLGCDGDGPDSACGASASPDGGRHGFAAITDLPASPVQVTLTLRDRHHRAFLDQELRLTPKPAHPDNPHCATGVQAALTVANGQATAR
ncbi:hypothetical protein GCM10009527_031570 [Actinomadura nitritigenes]|uniref:Lipoprotein n=1 Tax=Actinomadura nitritigenes TaxID=134602 RepID=A0ABS3QUH5_9ACTN|nr:hypothetical protein [Actinomadura nitritigenes]MBO2437581.1 hypothetical protein [Actinomadura nitritigenes]